MVTDAQVDLVYFADTLQKKHPQFYEELIRQLDENDIRHELLIGTNDIWAKDYMPIQVKPDSFVQFIYKPDYLKTKAEIASITDVDKVCYNLGIQPRKIPLVVDGGNVVCSTNKVIMCDKVFTENPSWSREAVIKELQQAFELDDIIFIPTHPEDWTGHADGLVRFLDDEWVFVNGFQNEKAFEEKLDKAIYEAGLQSMVIAYNPYDNKDMTSARGLYINYLRMSRMIMVPKFGLEEDEPTIDLAEMLFTPTKSVLMIDCEGKVLSIESNSIAAQGGVLNCISWGIKG